MSTLEHLVRTSLAAESENAADATGLLAGVASRVDRNGSPTWSAPALSAAAVTLLVVVAFTLGRLVSPSPAPSGADPTSASAPALVTEGECAGLSLRVENGPSADGSPGALVSIIQPGTGNTVTVDGNHLLLLHATGPCVDRLRYDVIEAAGQDALQGASGDARQSLNREGVGLLVSHATGRATAVVDFAMDCSPETDCRTVRTSLAAVTVTVVAPYLDGITHEPTPAGTS